MGLFDTAADLEESFLTGETGVFSALSGGGLPIYGEPQGESVEKRREQLAQGVGMTATEVAKNPAKAIKTGAKVIRTQVQQTAEAAAELTDGAVGGIVGALWKPALLLGGVLLAVEVVKAGGLAAAARRIVR